MNLWKLDALNAIRQVADEKALFTSDDVHALIAEPANCNQWGDAFREAKRLGLIEEAGYVKSKRPESKGRRVIQWRKAERDQAVLI